MDSNQGEFFGANVTTIILRSLYEEDRYGYDILREIDKKSQGSYQVKQATLYSCLKRLEKSGLIKAFWGGEDGSTGGGRRRYYSLTDKGRGFLDKNRLAHKHTRTLLNKFLSEASEADGEDGASLDINGGTAAADAFSETDGADTAFSGMSGESFAAFVENAEPNSSGSFTSGSNNEKTFSESFTSGGNAGKTFQTSLFDIAADDRAPKSAPPQKPVFVEIPKNYAVYDLPENFAEKPAESIKPAEQEEEIYIPYTTSAKYDFRPFDYGEQQERARIQHEEYYKQYERTLAEKELSASKMYDAMYAPSLPYSGVIKENHEPSAPPPPPPPAYRQSAYNGGGGLFAAYGPQAADESDGLTDDEKKDYASKKLGIGRYRDPEYAGKIISENERAKANAKNREENSFPPERTETDEKQSISSAVPVGKEKPFGLTNESYDAYAQNDGQTANAESRRAEFQQNDGYYNDANDEYDQNTRFLDGKDLKFHQFEKYDAKNDKDVNYKSVFTDEILVKRAEGEYQTTDVDSSDADEIRGDAPRYFHDVKNKLTNEGYEVKAYNKANTSEFYAKNYIFNGKIKAHTSLAAWGVWLVEIFMAAALFSEFFRFGLSDAAFWCFAFIPAAVPLFFWAAYGINPGKRVKDDFDVKRAVKTNLIVAAVLFALTSVVALCFLNAAANGNWRASILIPAILFTNLPLSAVIYDTLKKTRKYNLS
ncbi:MAG: PadR family transcriptional regulator [Clostridiales bacterium]|jgi:PadR family transcriptional regulator PadR|nr:PadR family transcriptional regulator [Clostridiales bacterium]